MQRAKAQGVLGEGRGHRAWWVHRAQGGQGECATAQVPLLPLSPSSVAPCNSLCLYAQSVGVVGPRGHNEWCLHKGRGEDTGRSGWKERHKECWVHSGVEEVSAPAARPVPSPSPPQSTKTFECQTWLSAPAL